MSKWSDIRRSLFDGTSDERQKALDDLHRFVKIQKSHGARKPARLANPTFSTVENLKGVVALCLLGPYTAVKPNKLTYSLEALIYEASQAARLMSPSCEDIFNQVLSKGGHVTQGATGKIMELEVTNPRNLPKLLIFQGLLLSWLRGAVLSEATNQLIQIFMIYTKHIVNNEILYDKLSRACQQIKCLNTYPIFATSWSDFDAIRGLKASSTQTEVQLWTRRRQYVKRVNHTMSAVDVKEAVRTVIDMLTFSVEAASCVISLIPSNHLTDVVTSDASFLNAILSSSSDTRPVVKVLIDRVENTESILASCINFVEALSSTTDQIKILTFLSTLSRLNKLKGVVLVSPPTSLQKLCTSGPFEARRAACRLLVFAYENVDIPTQVVLKEFATMGEEDVQISRRACLAECLPAVDGTKLITMLTSLWSSAVTKVTQRADALLSLRGILSLSPAKEKIAGPVAAVLPHICTFAVLEKVAKERNVLLAIVEALEHILLSSVEEASWNQDCVLSTLIVLLTARFGSVRSRAANALNKVLASKRDAQSTLTTFWNAAIEIITGVSVAPPAANVFPETSSAPKPGGKSRHGFDYAALTGQKKSEVESKKPEEKKGKDKSADKPGDKTRRALWEASVPVAEKESLEVPKGPASKPLTKNVTFLFRVVSRAVFHVLGRLKSLDSNATTILGECVALMGHIGSLGLLLAPPDVPKQWRQGRYSLESTRANQVLLQAFILSGGDKLVKANSEAVLSFLMTAITASSNVNFSALRDSATRAIPFVLHVLPEVAMTEFLTARVLPLLRSPLDAVTEADVVESVALENSDLLAAVVAYELKEEAKAKGANKESKGRSDKGYSAKDEAWEKQLRKEIEDKANEAAREVTEKADRERIINRLLDRRTDLENTTVRPLIAALAILREITVCPDVRPTFSKVVFLVIPTLIELMGKSAANVARVTLLNVDVITRILKNCCDKEFSRVALPTATLVSRLFTRYLDPTRAKVDNDTQFTETMLMRIRGLANRTLATSTFCVLFPIAKLVLMTEKTAFVSKSKIAPPPPETITQVMTTTDGREVIVKVNTSTPVIKKFSYLQWAQQLRALPKITFSQTAQQVALMLITTNCGNPEIPFRTDLVNVLIHVMTHIASLHKSACSALCSVSVNLTPNEVTPLLECMYSSYPAVKEAALTTLKTFPRECREDPNTCDTLRRALYLNTHEEHLGIARKALDLYDNLFKFSSVKEDAFALCPQAVSDVSNNRDAAARAISAIHSRFPEVLPNIMEGLSLSFKSAQGEPRIGVAKTLQSIEKFDSTQLLNAFEFILSQGLKDPTDEVQTAFLLCGRTLVAREASAHYEIVMNFFNAKFDAAKSGGEATTSALVVFMSTMIVVRHSSSDLPTVLNRLMEVIKAKNSGKIVHMTVCDCIKEISAKYGREKPDEFEKIVKCCLETLFTQKQGQQSAPLDIRRGCALAIAGTISGTGLRAIRDHKLIPLFESEVVHKATPHRESALLLLASLTSVLRALFEPYVIDKIQLLVASYSDKDNSVRQATSAAAKELMRNLSDFGVHQIVPKLVETLQSTSWRTKINVMQLLGSMSFCSTKQLAAALPTIIPTLIVVLTDTHEEVSQSAFDAIRRFGSIISCEEIREHVDVLLTALRFPGTETENALDALLFTRFFSTIDIASLALMMPVLLRGLKERSTPMKMKAAQISGSVTQLVSDQSIILPYSGELMDRLFSALFEPLAECQATAAKAVASLVGTLGETRFPHLIDKFLAKLADPGIIASERSGSAKGLAEVIAKLGVKRLDKIMPVLVSGFHSDNAQIRDGHAQLLIHLPRSLGAEFQNNIPSILPLLLLVLADTHEIVRSTALTAGQAMVTLYGTKCLHILLPPLKEGLLGANPRVRESSLHLISELLIRVAVPKAELFAEKYEEEDEEEDDEKEEEEEQDVEAVMQAAEKERKRSARQQALDRREGLNRRVETLIGLIGETAVYEVFAAVYLMRLDASKNVRNSANSLWRTVVTNAASMLQRVHIQLSAFIARLLWAGDEESESTGEKAIGGVLAKIGDSALENLFKMLSDRIDSKPETGRPGCYAGMSEIMRFVSKTLFTNLAQEVIRLLLLGISDPDEETRAGSALLMDTASRAGGIQFMEIIVRTLLDLVQESERNIPGYISMFKAKPKPILASTMSLLTNSETTLVPVHANLLTSMITTGGSEELFEQYVDEITELLSDAIEENIVAPGPYLATFAALVPAADKEDFKEVLKGILSQASGSPHESERCAGLHLLGAYSESLSGEDSTWKDAMADVVTVVVRAYGDTDKQVLKVAMDTLKKVSFAIDKCAAEDDSLSGTSTAASLGKDNHAGLVHFFALVDGCIQATHQGAGLSNGGLLPGAEQPNGLDPVLPFYLNTVIQGSSDQKIAATQGLGSLIHTVSPQAAGKYVSSIVGRLVRITFEKPPPIVIMGIVEVAAVLAEHIPAPAFKLHVLSTLQVVCQKALPDDDVKMRLIALRYLSIIGRKHGASVNLDLAVKHFSEAFNASSSRPAVTASIARGFTILVRGRGEPISDKSYGLIYPLLRSAYESASSTGTSACIGKAFGLCFTAKAHAEEDTKQFLSLALQSPTALTLSFLEGLLTSGLKDLPTKPIADMAVVATTNTVPLKPYVALQGVRLAAAILRNSNSSKEEKNTVIEAATTCLAASISAALDSLAPLECAGWDLVDVISKDDSLVDKKRRNSLYDLRDDMRRSEVHSAQSFFDAEVEAEMMWAPKEN